LCLGRVGRPLPSGGERGESRGDENGFSPRSGEGTSAAAGGWRTVPRVLDRDSARSALTNRKGSLVSGSRNGSLFSSVALQDWINEDTEADLRCWSGTGVGNRGGTSSTISSFAALLLANAPIARSRKDTAGALDARDDRVRGISCVSSRIPRSSAGVFERRAPSATALPPRPRFTNADNFSESDVFVRNPLSRFINGVKLPRFRFRAALRPQNQTRATIMITPKTPATAPPTVPPSIFFPSC
jgi:hypothetical protein